MLVVSCSGYCFVSLLVTGSKSSTFEQQDKSKQYKRAISAPGHHGGKGQPGPVSEISQNQKVQLQDGGFTVTDIDRGVEGHTEHIKATQVHYMYMGLLYTSELIILAIQLLCFDYSHFALSSL